MHLSGGVFSTTAGDTNSDRIVTAAASVQTETAAASVDTIIHPPHRERKVPLIGRVH